VWNYVNPHFTRFLNEIELKPWERADAEGKAHRVARCLWAKYYLGEFAPRCCLTVGSYGKGTACRPPSDIDLLFLLPASSFARVGGLQGNQQSQMLQEIKRSLLLTFPRTDLRADGQVVAAPFQTYNVEVVPAFSLNDGTYLTANTAGDGSWRLSNPMAEYGAIAQADSASAGKATHLLRMLKPWKRECSVEIKSIALEVLVCEFVKQWSFRERTLLYYDWLLRDFFEFMLRYKNGWTRVPGTTEIIQLGDKWVSRCRSAYERTLRACEYERLDCGALAAAEWQKVFGEQFLMLFPTVRAVPA
jgi:Second Messenger Oligonucleotide or Dinucleotide Synthetase domain